MDKEQSFYQTVLQKLGFHMQKKKKKNRDTDFISFTKIDSKLVINLNIKCKTIKLLERNTGEKNQVTLGLAASLQMQYQKHLMWETIDRLNCIKIENVCCEEESAF